MPYYRCPACGLTGYSAARHFDTRVCPNCSAALPDDAKRYPVDRGVREIVGVVAARPQAGAEARRTLVGLAVSQETREKLALVVTELITNSVIHSGLPAGHPIDLAVSNHAGRVRLVVHDGGHGFDPASVDGGDALAPGGRGLVLVAALSDAWGVDCGGDGCTVWCEIPAYEAAAATKRFRRVQSSEAAVDHAWVAASG
jgi:anti-sigma regulatory factor (Ser/Thr protein kinase)